ncbi:hypothetical protein HGRIS_001289 [Hohenbuehelia grisea]|uniref:BZIP domain-containing protein n=1 Tax=Hohenbuehelia grisea TaxID=104357 RepID=A0ABR3JP27_9AGAR
MSLNSRRGRKRNNALPYNEARETQRSFRMRRTAHLAALESRNDELEAENAGYRELLGLPAPKRTPLGRGPTGLSKPRLFPPSASQKTSAQLRSRAPDDNNGASTSPVGQYTPSPLHPSNETSSLESYAPASYASPSHEAQAQSRPPGDNNGASQAGLYTSSPLHSSIPSNDTSLFANDAPASYASTSYHESQAQFRSPGDNNGASQVGLYTSSPLHSSIPSNDTSLFANDAPASYASTSYHESQAQFRSPGDNNGASQAGLYTSSPLHSSIPSNDTSLFANDAPASYASTSYHESQAQFRSPGDNNGASQVGQYTPSPLHPSNETSSLESYAPASYASPSHEAQAQSRPPGDNNGASQAGLYTSSPLHSSIPSNDTSLFANDAPASYASTSYHESQAQFRSPGDNNGASQVGQYTSSPLHSSIPSNGASLFANHAPASYASTSYHQARAQSRLPGDNNEASQAGQYTSSILSNETTIVEKYSPVSYIRTSCDEGQGITTWAIYQRALQGPSAYQLGNQGSMFGEARAVFSGGSGPSGGLESGLFMSDAATL